MKVKKYGDMIRSCHKQSWDRVNLFFLQNWDFALVKKNTIDEVYLGKKNKNNTSPFPTVVVCDSASDICSEVGAYLSYLQEIICYKLRVLISLICIKLFVKKSECIFLLFALISTRWSCWDLWAFNTTPD